MNYATTFKKASWITRSLPLRARQRSFSVTSIRPRDLLAKYAPPPPSALPFLTSSTHAVSSSLQEVPSPEAAAQQSSTGRQGSIAAGKRLATPLPAMVPLEDTIAKTAARKMMVGVRKGFDVLGVHVPPEPVPPGEEECCMSGCVNCVYNLYADDVLAYNESLTQARQALLAAGVPKPDWPRTILRAEKGGGDPNERAKQAMEETKKGMDPSLKAFLEMEAKLKARRAAA